MEARLSRDVLSSLASIIGTVVLCYAGPAFGQVPQAKTATPAAQVPAWWEDALGDATLHDVTFVDARLGWTVGDRGVIWSTTDGGVTWNRQATGIRDTLHSVCFLDDRQGWAAGGATDPYTHVSRGVILNTRDGGRTWRTEGGALLPIIRRVKFLTPQQGWAWGDSSPLHPSGIFFTSDGGRRWTPLPFSLTANHDKSPLPAEYEPGWSAGDFLDPFSGVIAGRRGLVAAVHQRGLQASAIPRIGIRAVRSIRLASNVGWLAGEGGLIATTADAGRTWQPPPGSLPGRTAEIFDFNAVATARTHVWIAGTPGTTVFHSPDGGKSWRSLPTDQTLPIHGLHFVDEQHGWAVGALGRVLATADGGRTWRVQRQGGARAAVLALFADELAVPSDALAQWCAGDGYRGVAEVLCRRDLDAGPLDLQTAADRFSQAINLAGGCIGATAWQFPARQRGVANRVDLHVAVWNRLHEGRGIARLQAYVARQIRMWRPEMIVTHGVPRGDGGDALERIVHDVVMQSVPGAADAQQFTTLAETGLAPWKVKKVLGLLPPGDAGELNLNTSQWSPQLGCSPLTVAGPAYALMGHEPVAETLQFQTMLNQGTDGGSGLWSGIVLPSPSEARRPLVEPQHNLEALRRSAERQRNARAILERAATDPAKLATLLGQLGLASKDSPDASADAAPQLLFATAQRFHRLGRAELAAETQTLLVKEYPQHALASAAQLWLLHYAASGEMAWRRQSAQQQALLQQANTVEPSVKFARNPQPGGAVQAGSTAPAGNIQPAGGVKSSAANAPAKEAGQQVEPDRLAWAAKVGKLLEQRDPALFADPRVRFPLAVAQIAQDDRRDSERLFSALRRSRIGSPWQRLAAGEDWLSTRQTAPPVSVLRCSRVTTKPYLDGQLDDAAWRGVAAHELRSRIDDDQHWKSSIQLAYDDEYLYLAATCHRPGHATAASKKKPRDADGDDEARPRDADLSRHDRIELLLDLDRDYVTYYRLAVDCRGWTGDACWGDATWNPQWFVAAADEGRTWTVEAAIPWTQLTGMAPGPRTAWAIGLQRTAPSLGFQSWSTPASTAIQPEGFGYLLFE